MNYCYIDLCENTSKLPAFLKKRRITISKIYSGTENTLYSFVMPINSVSCFKILISRLRDYKIDFVLFSEHVLQYKDLLKEDDIEIINGSSLRRLLLPKTVDLHIKTVSKNKQKNGIHICAENIDDISFLFDNLCKYNTVFSMCTETEKHFDYIFEKYGISVHFTDIVSDKYVLFLGGMIPKMTNSDLFDMEKCKITLDFGILPDIFKDKKVPEAELLIRLLYANFEEGFADSKIKIKSVFPINFL